MACRTWLLKAWHVQFIRSSVVSMTRLTANDIIRAIDHLPKNRFYNYIEPATRTKIQVVRVQPPEGPVYFKRFNPEEGGTAEAAKQESISAGFIRRIANAASPGGFLNF